MERAATILAVAGAVAGFVVWMLALQKSVHDDYREIQRQVNQVLRTDAIEKAAIRAELDEHHRWLCTYRAHAGHLGCD